jgi:structural maintenance of chromosome 1
LFLVIELLIFHDRTTFQEEQLITTRERLQSLDKTIKLEKSNVANLQKNKEIVEDEIRLLKGEIEALKDDIHEYLDDLEKKTKELEVAKKAAIKASKGLDAVLKEIATMVSISVILQIDCC